MRRHDRGGAARRTCISIVGHSHSFDAPILRTRDADRERRLRRGAHDPRAQLHGLPATVRAGPRSSTPRRAAARCSIRRRIRSISCACSAAAAVKSVRAATGAWDAARPTEGAYSALLTFEGGAFASLTYGGYGHFDSDEFQGWIGEMGQAKTALRAQRRRALPAPRTRQPFKNARNYGGAAYQPAAAQDACASALRHDHRELRARRPAPDAERRDDLPERRRAPRSAAAAGRAARRSDRRALRRGRPTATPPLHDGAWAMATLEVCLAILRSAREGREIALAHQVAVR